MTLEHPWMLLLLLLPCIWSLLDRRPHRQRNRTAGAARVSAAVLILALSQPNLTVRKSNPAVTVLTDTSSSISETDLRSESEFIQNLQKIRGKDAIRVIPFTRSTWIAETAQRGTNIETAIRESLTTPLTSGRLSRLVIMSDGAEDIARAQGAVRQAQQFGIPIDTVPLAGRARPGLRIERETAPASVYRGQRFPIDLRVWSADRTTAELQLRVDGKPNVSNRVMLLQGANSLRLDATIETAGAVQIAVVIKEPRMPELRTTRRLAVHQPRALLVSGHAPGLDSSFMQELASERLDLVRAADIPPRLDQHEIVILDHLERGTVSNAHTSALREFVNRGGGLAVIADARTLNDPDSSADVLDQALPATVPPDQRSCIVLVVERSAKMDGEKLELAKLTALGLVENLRRTDLLGVLVFDDSFRWAVPIHTARERDPVNLTIRGLTAGGGAQIAGALREAVRRLQTVDASFKQIVVLTNGTSQDLTSLALARTAAAHRIAISAVSIGDDSNHPFLSRLTDLSGGKTVFLSDPSGLDTAVALAARRNQPIVFNAGARVLVGRRDSEPRLMRWKYGRGHAEVLISEVDSSARHLAPGMFRYLLPRIQAPQTTVRYDPDRDSNSSNEALLRWMSSSTGGHFNPSPSAVLSRGRTIPASLPLWPALVLFAFGLVLLDVVPGSVQKTRLRPPMHPHRPQ